MKKQKHFMNADIIIITNNALIITDNWIKTCAQWKIFLVWERWIFWYNIIK